MIGLLLLEHYIANNCPLTLLIDDKQLSEWICIMNKTEDTRYNTTVIQLTFVIVWNDGEVGYNLKDVQFNCNDQ